MGYGYTRPLESDDTRARREANRRVMATIPHTITEEDRHGQREGL